VITVAIVAGYYLIASVQRGALATAEGYVAPFYQQSLLPPVEAASAGAR
jgi:hypothetical protein